VFIERLWRSLKHEDIYLKGYVDRREAHAGIGSWIDRDLPVRHQGAMVASPAGPWGGTARSRKLQGSPANADLQRGFEEDPSNPQANRYVGSAL
jgi:putative transposase